MIAHQPRGRGPRGGDSAPAGLGAAPRALALALIVPSRPRVRVPPPPPRAVLGRVPDAREYALASRLVPNASDAANARFGASVMFDAGLVASVVNASAVEVFALDADGSLTASAPSRVFALPDPDAERRPGSVRAEPPLVARGHARRRSSSSARPRARAPRAARRCGATTTSPDPGAPSSRPARAPTATSAARGSPSPPPAARASGWWSWARRISTTARPRRRVRLRARDPGGSNLALDRRRQAHSPRSRRERPVRRERRRAPRRGGRGDERGCWPPRPARRRASARCTRSRGSTGSGEPTPP